MLMGYLRNMGTSSSTPGKTSTNAPKETSRLTVPSMMDPSLIFSFIFSHGPGNVSLIEKGNAFPLGIKFNTFTLTVSPTATTSDGCSTCS